MRLPSWVSLGDIRYFRVSFTSGQPDPLSTEDNWNMESITVTYPTDGDSATPLFEDSGDPLQRFDGKHSSWTEILL